MHLSHITDCWKMMTGEKDLCSARHSKQTWQAHGWHLKAPSAKSSSTAGQRQQPRCLECSRLLKMTLEIFAEFVSVMATVAICHSSLSPVPSFLKQDTLGWYLIIIHQLIHPSFNLLSWSGSWGGLGFKSLSGSTGLGPHSGLEATALTGTYTQINVIHHSVSIPLC